MKKKYVWCVVKDEDEYFSFIHYSNGYRKFGGWKCICVDIYDVENYYDIININHSEKYRCQKIRKHHFIEIKSKDFPISFVCMFVYPFFLETSSFFIFIYYPFLRRERKSEKRMYTYIMKRLAINYDIEMIIYYRILMDLKT